MQIEQEKKENLLILRLKGDIDINTSPDLKRSLDKMIGRKENNVVINLQEVNYIDSSGLATMVEILKNLRTHEGRLKLTNLTAKVKGLFEITKLDGLFDILTEEAAAMSSF
ncbi:MAG: STAS domain-containing protein [Candidatus Omnitrophota bacterium]